MRSICYGTFCSYKFILIWKRQDFAQGLFLKVGFLWKFGFNSQNKIEGTLIQKLAMVIMSKNVSKRFIKKLVKIICHKIHHKNLSKNSSNNPSNNSSKNLSKIIKNKRRQKEKKETERKKEITFINKGTNIYYKRTWITKQQDKYRFLEARFACPACVRQA